MKLSVIVTNYKTLDLLKLCLGSIKKAGVDLDYELIIVDSEAQEETAWELKTSFPDLNLVSFKENKGYAKVVNAGLELAKGDFILILNADMILFEDSLKIMLDYLEKNPEVGLLGPQLLNFNGSIQDSFFSFYKPSTIIYRRTFLGKTKRGKAELTRFLMRDFDRGERREVDWLLGAALMLRRQALEQVGPMDERFFLYFEDVDWCRRFRERGWRVVYLPTAKMHHYHGQGSKKKGGLVDLFFNKYTWIHILSAVKYFWKYR